MRFINDFAYVLGIGLLEAGSLAMEAGAHIAAWGTRND